MAKPPTHGSSRKKAVLTLLAVTLVAGSLGAQGMTNEALAEALFQEGKRLMETGRFGEACPKLAESMRLDPGGGTQLLLGQCYEKLGKTATAWTIFNDALATSRKANRADREKIAKDRIVALEARLAKLTLRVAPELSSLPGFSVTLDGTLISQAAFGTPLPIDPGSHEIVTVATGYTPGRVRIDITTDGEKRSVDVPTPTKDAPPPPTATTSAPPPPPATTTAPPPKTTTAPPPADGAWKRPAGYASLGVGLLSIGVGSILALSAKSKYDDSKELCPTSPCSNKAGLDLNDSARARGNVATLFWGVGLVGVGAGTWFLVSAPRHETTVAIVPGGASFRTSF